MLLFARPLALLLLLWTTLCTALRFELVAGHGEPKCIRNFASSQTLVAVRIETDGHSGDGQRLNVHIKDAAGNDFSRLKDVHGTSNSMFKASDAPFDICFENLLTGHSSYTLKRSIELDVDIGADAKPWDNIQAEQKLKPVERELKRIEETMSEISNGMNYLRERETRLRDTNESTNERVKWFSLTAMGLLVGLGAWQITYLRAYFRSKHLI